MAYDTLLMRLQAMRERHFSSMTEEELISIRLLTENEDSTIQYLAQFFLTSYLANRYAILRGLSCEV